MDSNITFTIEEPATEPATEPVTEPEPVVEPLPEPEPVPDPDPFITYLQTCTGKFALLVGLNYNNQLSSRIQIINNTKQILIKQHGFDELNIYTLLEPTEEELQQTLLHIISMSSQFSELWIYYAGYGNKYFDKIMVPCDNTSINITSTLMASSCKTLCILDTCPDDGDANFKIKWTADVYNHVKVLSFCESDSLATNKNALIQTMIQSYLQLTNNH